MNHLARIRNILNQVTFNIFGQEFLLKVQNFEKSRRIFIQVFYKAPCTKTGKIEEWKGRKWDISKFATDSEIIFTAYTACKMAMEHEIMESFKVNNIILINPHVDYKELLNISHIEVKRTQK
jgi:hypothetical protein